MSKRATLKNLKYLIAAYALMLLVIFILPYYSLEDYTITNNTTSHLGAQSTPNSWIMNLTFILLGISSIWSGWKFLGNYWFPKILLTVFGIALVMTAIFQHAPIDSSLEYSIREDKLHSFFANMTGVSFSAFAVSLGLITTRKTHKILAFTVTVLAPVLSILMFYEHTKEWMGIWQRLIFIGMFGWMIYAFSTHEIKT